MESRESLVRMAHYWLQKAEEAKAVVDEYEAQAFAKVGAGRAQHEDEDFNLYRASVLLKDRHGYNSACKKVIAYLNWANTYAAVAAVTE